MSSHIDEALLLTATQFRGVVDKEGRPFILHCLRVMMSFSDSSCQLAGLMHDLIEDTPVTIEQLQAMGFEPEVIEAIDLLTHRPEESYADYICKLKKHPVARKVKMVDLLDNASLTRVPFRAGRQDEDLDRIRRYVLSYQYLSERLDQEHYLEMMKEQ